MAYQGLAKAKTLLLNEILLLTNTLHVVNIKSLLAYMILGNK